MLLNFKTLKAKVCLISILTFLLNGCKTDFEEPKISLEDYVVEPGFGLEVIASEPFLEAPVAIDFDNQGRIWTVEMRGYMQTLTGESETMPNGVISILEDKDGDGVVDHSKVFLDSLVLPRAIAHVYGGLLYAEPPNLWFVEIEDDKPGKKVLVDSLYADDGNVEHQPNGLMMNIDNWIYNARSHFRYQKKDGVWHKEPTAFRGQWGITKDNFGRLYYNNNSTQIMGDYVLPNVLTRNQFYEPKDGLAKVLTRNQRVYPLHATLVNRGYQDGVLDQDSMLVNVTSSCGPLVYRGGQFPTAYDQNAFVCAPEVNLIKRNLLTFDGPMTTAKQAYDDREFIASTDEGFRPVNLSSGPDGGMYIVDMHRGIIQHGAYMTSYLRERLAAAGMDKMIGMGRILRVKNIEKGLAEVPDLTNASARELVNLLSNKNGWVRDRAQQLIIHKKLTSIKGDLVDIITSDQNGLASIHALYALEGMGMLSHDILMKTANSNVSEVVSHSLLLLKRYKTLDNGNAEVELVNKLMALNDPTIDLYLMSFLGEWTQRYGYNVMPLLATLAEKQLKQYYQDALISGLSGQEKDFIASLRFSKSPHIDDLVSQLNDVVKDREAQKKYWIYEQASLPLDDRTHGLQLYRETCSACHGGNGRGIEGLAPPLDNSDWVKGSVDRLVLVLLHGLKGPVNVNGEKYEFNAQMPGLANNPDFSDQDITDLITYLSNAFGSSSRGANPQLVKALREVKPKDGAFTEEEINTVSNEK
ncbi:MAG: mono/diheme cytochrome c family protein [Roseivirga sp.]|jgi:mono/diheme cytochrome c family protein